MTESMTDFLNPNLNLITRTRLLMAETRDLKMHPGQSSGFRSPLVFQLRYGRIQLPLGRDGSPSRPFARRGPNVASVNGGFGEPALPKQKRGLKAPSSFQLSLALALAL